MCEIISYRMSDRVLLCIGRLSNKLLSKKSSWRAGVVEEMKAEVIYQEVNKSRLTDYFNKIPGEKKSLSTIDFKVYVFFFVYVYAFFLTVIFINKDELME